MIPLLLLKLPLLLIIIVEHECKRESDWVEAIRWRGRGKEKNELSF
jgi:hypothetical protein